MVTIRVRSMVWFATGAVLALVVSLTVMQAWRVDAAPGDTDTTFVSMTSCRMTDTRPAPDRIGTNGSWGIADTKTLQATGTNGNCTIPTEAVALSLKVFALNATADGFLTFWADGALPLGSALNPSPGGIVFSAVTTDLSAAGSFKVFNKNGTVDVIIDVNGYYTKDSLKNISTRLLALEAAQATNTGKIATLDLAQPFARSAFLGTIVALPTVPTAVLSLPVTAPANGQVTLNYTAIIHLLQNDGNDGYCAIAKSTNIPGDLLTGFEESASTFEKDGLSDSGFASGTRTFDVTAGTTTTYVLACQKSGGATGELRARNMTAIYTPAP